MLKVEIGYYNFIFPEEECGAACKAFNFAKAAHDHLSREDGKNKVAIVFLNENEEEETE